MLPLCSLNANRLFNIRMTRTEIEEKVRDFMIEDMEIAEEKVHANALLKEDMGIDSLDYVDIIVIVNRIFGFKIKLEEMTNVKTLGDFCDYIEQKIKE